MVKPPLREREREIDNGIISKVYVQNKVQDNMLLLFSFVRKKRH